MTVTPAVSKGQASRCCCCCRVCLQDAHTQHTGTQAQTGTGSDLRQAAPPRTGPFGVWRTELRRRMCDGPSGVDSLSNSQTGPRISQQTTDGTGPKSLSLVATSGRASHSHVPEFPSEDPQTQQQPPVQPATGLGGVLAHFFRIAYEADAVAGSPTKSSFLLHIHRPQPLLAPETSSRPRIVGRFAIRPGTTASS